MIWSVKYCEINIFFYLFWTRLESCKSLLSCCKSTKVKVFLYNMTHTVCGIPLVPQRTDTIYMTHIGREWAHLNCCKWSIRTATKVASASVRTISNIKLGLSRSVGHADFFPSYMIDRGRTNGAEYLPGSYQLNPSANSFNLPNLLTNWFIFRRRFWGKIQAVSAGICRAARLLLKHWSVDSAATTRRLSSIG